MKVALCLIARLESKYIKEFIEYYKTIGFDKIFLYDNNRHYDSDNITEKVKNYVDDGFVTLKKWDYDYGNVQKPAYQHCFNANRNEYDWIAFFDADEYIVLPTGMAIQEFLSQEKFNDFGGIAIPSVNYDDNDLLVNNSETRLDKYTRPTMTGCDKTFYKTIVRCKKNNVNFSSFVSDGCHLPYMNNNKICDINGNIVEWNHIRCDNKTDYVFLKHIPTGCIDDYVNFKDKRGWPDTFNDKKFGIEFFAEYNMLTQEKIDYYEQHRQ